MSHTKEKLEFERIEHDEGHFSYEFNQGGRLISISECCFDKPMEAKLYADRIAATWNACSTLKDPEREIKDLIMISKVALESCKCSIFERASGHLIECYVPTLESALKPFKQLTTEGGE